MAQPVVERNGFGTTHAEDQILAEHRDLVESVMPIKKTSSGVICSQPRVFTDRKYGDFYARAFDSPTGDIYLELDRDKMDVGFEFRYVTSDPLERVVLQNLGLPHIRDLGTHTRYKVTSAPFDLAQVEDLYGEIVQVREKLAMTPVINDFLNRALSVGEQEVQTSDSRLVNALNSQKGLLYQLDGTAYLAHGVLAASYGCGDQVSVFFDTDQFELTHPELWGRGESRVFHIGIPKDIGILSGKSRVPTINTFSDAMDYAKASLTPVNEEHKWLETPDLVHK